VRTAGDSNSRGKNTCVGLLNYYKLKEIFSKSHKGDLDLGIRIHPYGIEIIWGLNHKKSTITLVSHNKSPECKP
jgi:hypothetical protein